MKTSDSQSDKIYQAELNKCNTLNEVIAVTNKYYNLDAPLGIMSKTLVVNGITQLIKMIKVVKRGLPNFN